MQREQGWLESGLVWSCEVNDVNDRGREGNGSTSWYSGVELNLPLLYRWLDSLGRIDEKEVKIAPWPSR